MRATERIFGVLAGILGLVALVLTLTQRTAQVVSGTAVMYGPGTDASNRLAIALPLALTVLGVALACLSAMLDARAGLRRGAWPALVIVGALLGIAGVWLLGSNGVWLDLGAAPGSLAPAASQVSVAALFFPAALAGAVAALLALFRRGARVAQA
jgi:hypothetical protein